MRKIDRIGKAPKTQEEIDREPQRDKNGKLMVCSNCGHDHIILNPAYYCEKCNRHWLT